MPVACAVEMIQTVYLMQDDLPCMDNSLLRRGKPSSHVVFGENVTVLAGGGLWALAFEHIAKKTVGVPPSTVVGVVAELARAFGSQGLTSGRFLEATSMGSSDSDEVRYLKKNAPMIEASVVMGSMIGGGSSEQTEILRKFARCVGLVIDDDLLDVTKSSQQIGKTAGNGKVTFPKLMGIEKSWEFAKKLNKEAQDMLSGFDKEKAAPLIAMVSYVTYREN